MRALALMYHDVVEDGDFASSGFPGRGADIYKLRREDFERQLEAIHRVTRGSVALINQAAFAESRPVFLTFDDGGMTARQPIAALLESFGWRGHFFITADRIGTPGFLGADDLRDLRRRGHIIGSHSCSHPTRMSALSSAEMDREWRESIARLSRILAEPVTTASVPGGYYSRQVGLSAAAAGIETLFTSEPTTSVETLNGCLVIGRYAIKRGMDAQYAASITAGRLGPLWKESALWQAKRIAKAAGGVAYLKLRHAIFDR